MRNRKRLLPMITTGLLTLALLAGCSGGGAKSGQVTVGSKDFTESIILGEMVAQYIQGNTDIKVTKKLNLGGSTVTFDGLKNGNLDMYVDYDGTVNGTHLGHKEPITDQAGFFDKVNKEMGEKFSLTFTKPFGFNNTYALAMPKALAEQYKIKTYSDLVAHSDKFVFGTTAEFMGRAADGYNPLVKAYGFKFKDVKQMVTGLRYKAIEQKEIQVMDAYATDGNLKAFDMLLLQDDKKFFPPYLGAVLVRKDTLEKNAGLKELLDKLGGTIDDKQMQELNYRVAVKEETVEAVAKDFLTAKGLLKK